MKYRKTLRLGKYYRAGNENPYKKNTPLAGDRKITELKEGKNKRSVWKVNTKPYKEAHFAVFPEKLIEPCIMAGCPEYICEKCDKSRKRIIEKETKFMGGSGKAGRTANDVNNKGKWKNKQYGKNIKLGPVIYTNTKGYTNCHCNADFKSGIVLDPFIGSGTTALVAKKLGRHYIGIELNPEYIKISEKRIKNYTNQLKLF